MRRGHFAAELTPCTRQIVRNPDVDEVAVEYQAAQIAEGFGYHIAFGAAMSTGGMPAIAAPTDGT